MKIKPQIFAEYKTQYLGVLVDLQFDCNLTFVSDDSGTGKTFLWNIMDKERLEDVRIVTLNYLSDSRSLADLKKVSGKLVVIDNADLILNTELRIFIATDDKNQYLVFGRDTDNFLLTTDNVKKIIFVKDDTGLSTLRLVSKYS